MRPLMPPASLTSLTASFAEFSAERPSAEAAGEVTGAKKPILIGSVLAGSSAGPGSEGAGASLGAHAVNAKIIASDSISANSFFISFPPFLIVMLIKSSIVKQYKKCFYKKV
jgi:hypothetical protein